jgi:hypothetical protein
MDPHDAVRPQGRPVAGPSDPVETAYDRDVTAGEILPVEDADGLARRADGSVDNDTADATPAPPLAAPTPQQIVRVERPARVLLGWLPDTQARLVQVGMRTDVPVEPAHLAAIDAARAAVSSRPEYVNNVAVIGDVPPALDGHVASLRAHPASAPFFTEGWRVAIVDLSQVCAAQPSVFIDHTEERVAMIDPDDWVAVAQVTLPLATAVNLPSQFDPVRNAWIVSAANPNLRVVGPGGLPAQPGVVMLGFGVSLTTSFVQVARFRGRYILRDGYHRSYGLLQRGITHVPAFVRDFSTVEELAFPAGLLPQDAYVGPHPATLSDYLKDTVSIDVKLPATLRMIVIQALELNPNA